MRTEEILISTRTSRRFDEALYLTQKAMELQEDTVPQVRPGSTDNQVSPLRLLRQSERDSKEGASPFQNRIR